MTPLASSGNRHRFRALRWGLSAAVLAAIPKCALCLIAWFALAMGARVELCGAPPRDRPAAVAVFAAVALLGAATIMVRLRRRLAS